MTGITFTKQEWSADDSQAVDEAKAELEDMKSTDPIVALAASAIFRTLTTLPSSFDDDLRALEWAVKYQRKVKDERDEFEGCAGNDTVQ